MKVTAPTAGYVTPLEAVADPVFAASLVGPGLAIEPADQAVQVRAPIKGTLVSCFPHAFVIEGKDACVLVHVGINTARVGRETFDVRKNVGDEVSRGELIVSFDAEVVRSRGAHPTVLVVALDEGPESLSQLAAAGAHVNQDTLLFRIVQFA